MRVRFYGQSITEQGWWKIVANDLRALSPRESRHRNPPRKYGADLGDQRAIWKRYALEPRALLRNNVHLNAHGEFLMAEAVKAYLRRDARFDPAPTEAWVTKLVVGKDVRWENG